MAILGILNQTGDKIENIIVGEHVDFPDSIVVDGTGIGIGWTHNGSDWVAPAEPEIRMLNISLSESVVVAGTSVNWTVEVTEMGSIVTDLTETYYVPVLRQDNYQVKLLKVEIINGEASGNITINEEGIYTIDASKIRPVPSSTEIANAELIVESV